MNLDPNIQTRIKQMGVHTTVYERQEKGIVSPDFDGLKNNITVVIGCELAC
jgi:hypothetical protein